MRRLDTVRQHRSGTIAVLVCAVLLLAPAISTTSASSSDTTAPSNAFTHPQANILKLADGTTAPIDLPPEVAAAHPDMSYILGHVTVYLNSSDAGADSSGLADADIIDEPTCDTEAVCGEDIHRPCQNTFGHPQTCRWDDRVENRWGVAFMDLRGESVDNAGNTATTYRNYTKVDLAAVEHPTQDDTTGTIHWEPYDGDDFAHYRVVGVSDEGGSLVETVEYSDQVQLQHVDPMVGETWTYTVTTVTTGPFGIGLVVEDVTHGTELTYVGVDGRVSQPTLCASSGCL